MDATGPCSDSEEDESGVNLDDADIDNKDSDRRANGRAQTQWQSLTTGSRFSWADHLKFANLDAPVSFFRAWLSSVSWPFRCFARVAMRAGNVSSCWNF